MEKDGSTSHQHAKNPLAALQLTAPKHHYGTKRVSLFKPYGSQKNKQVANPSKDCSHSMHYLKESNYLQYLENSPLSTLLVEEGGETRAKGALSSTSAELGSLVTENHSHKLS